MAVVEVDQIELGFLVNVEGSFGLNERALTLLDFEEVQFELFVGDKLLQG